MLNKIKYLANQKWPFDDFMTLTGLMVGMLWFMYFNLSWGNISFEDIISLCIHSFAVLFIANITRYPF